MCDYIKKYLKRNTYVYISPEAFDCANKIVCDCIIWAQFALSGEAEKRRSGEAEKRRILPTPRVVSSTLQRTVRLWARVTTVRYAADGCIICSLIALVYDI